MHSEALGDAAGERGAGGKVRRPFGRKAPSTPYARPLSQQRRPGVLGGGGGWISKIVNPAYRLIAGGATRLLPSVFSSASTPSLPAPLPRPHDAAEKDGEHTMLNQEIRSEKQESLVNLDVSKSTSVSGPSEPEGRRDVCNSVEVRRRKSQDLAGGGELSHIEELIKGKTFCREEIDRLMGILQSRVVDVEGGGKISNVTSTEKDEKLEISLGNPKSKNEEKQKDSGEDRLATLTPLPQPTVKDEIGASPIEIAKAYMGSRTSEFDFGSKSLVLKNERLLSHRDELASIRFLPPSSPKSSICWPGAIIEEQHGCLTPQRSRYGLNYHPRTPYSRTIYSRYKSKLTAPSEGDSRKLLDISSTPLQSQTPVYTESRIRMTEDGQGSVGPIRRLRHKFVSKTPSRGSPSLWSSQKGSLQVKESIHGSAPKTVETGATGTFQSLEHKGLFEADTSVVHPQTSKLARQILEQISRTPTRKEKSEELKLAIAKKKSSTSEVSGTTTDTPTTSYVRGYLPEKERERSPFFKDQSTNVRTGSINGAENDVNSASKILKKSSSSFGNIRSSTTNQDPVKENNIPQPDKGKVAAINLLLAGTQVLSTQKGPITSGTRPVLPPISVNKSNQRVRFTSENSNSGFTFPTAPLSSSLSEPPTPSILPFSSTTTMNPPKDVGKPPTYTFGENKSAALVFSFPSTSNAPAPTNTPIFKFGSEGSRISFSSIGKDAVCC